MVVLKNKKERKGGDVKGDIGCGREREGGEERKGKVVVVVDVVVEGAKWGLVAY